jgi:hypothetical protein
MPVTVYGHRNLDEAVAAAGWEQAGGVLLSTTPPRYLLQLAAAWYEYTAASSGRIVLAKMTPAPFLPAASRASGRILGVCWFASVACRSLAAIGARLAEDEYRAGLDHPDRVPVRVAFETDADTAVLRMTAPQAVPAGLWPQVETDDRWRLTTVAFEDLAAAVHAQWALHDVAESAADA